MWLRLEAAVDDDPGRVAIREGLAFGKALHAHLRLPPVAERGQPTRVRSRVEPPLCAPILVDCLGTGGRAEGADRYGWRLAGLKLRCQARHFGSNGFSGLIAPAR